MVKLFLAIFTSDDAGCLYAMLPAEAKDPPEGKPCAVNDMAEKEQTALRKKPAVCELK